MKSNIKAIYCGSFDPVTFGHEWVINSAAKMFDLTVVIANNPSKKCMFNIDERLDLMKKSVPFNVAVSTLKSGLLTNYCLDNDVNVIVRGLRSINDLEVELQIANTNRDLASTVETVFIPAPSYLNYISSSQVKEVASLGGDVSKYVNKHVKEALTKSLAL